MDAQDNLIDPLAMCDTMNAILGPPDTVLEVPSEVPRAEDMQPGQAFPLDSIFSYTLDKDEWSQGGLVMASSPTSPAHLPFDDDMFAAAEAGHNLSKQESPTPGATTPCELEALTPDDARSPGATSIALDPTPGPFEVAIDNVINNSNLPHSQIAAVATAEEQSHEAHEHLQDFHSEPETGDTVSSRSMAVTSKDVLVKISECEESMMKFNALKNEDMISSSRKSMPPLALMPGMDHSTTGPLLPSADFLDVGDGAPGATIPEMIGESALSLALDLGGSSAIGPTTAHSAEVGATRDAEDPMRQKLSMRLNEMYAACEPDTRTGQMGKGGRVTTDVKSLITNMLGREGDDMVRRLSGGTDVLTEEELKAVTAAAATRLTVSGKMSGRKRKLSKRDMAKLMTAAESAREQRIAHLAQTKQISDDELLRLKPKKQRRAAKFDKPVPSRFCHVCSRTPKNVRLVKCCRIREGTCRKVICEKCFAEYKYGDFEQALKTEMTEWMCPHCLGKCPERAQCRTYQRINDRLRVSRLKQEKPRSGGGRIRKRRGGAGGSSSSGGGFGEVEDGEMGDGGSELGMEMEGSEDGEEAKVGQGDEMMKKVM